MKYTGKSLTVNVTELFTADLGVLWGLECCRPGWASQGSLFRGLWGWVFHMNWFFGGLCNWGYWNGRFNNLRFCIGRLISWGHFNGRFWFFRGVHRLTGFWRCCVQYRMGASSHQDYLFFIILGFSGHSVMSHSWGNQVCLHNGVGVKAWLYLPMTWSHQGPIYSLAGSISMGWSNCINNSCRSWHLLNFVQGGIPSILYLVSASRMTV